MMLSLKKICSCIYMHASVCEGTKRFGCSKKVKRSKKFIDGSGGRIWRQEKLRKC